MTLTTISAPLSTSSKLLVQATVSGRQYPGKNRWFTRSAAMLSRTSASYAHRRTRCVLLRPSTMEIAVPHAPAPMTAISLTSRLLRGWLELAFRPASTRFTSLLNRFQPATYASISQCLEPLPLVLLTCTAENLSRSRPRALHHHTMSKHLPNTVLRARQQAPDIVLVPHDDQERRGGDQQKDGRGDALRRGEPPNTQRKGRTGDHTA